MPYHGGRRFSVQMWNWNDYQLLTLHLNKNGTSDSLIHSHFNCPSITCLLKHMQQVLFKPSTAWNCEPWPERPPVWTPKEWAKEAKQSVCSAGREHKWDDVEVCSGFYQPGAASLPAWPRVFTWRNWVYLRDWSSSSGVALLTCSLSMELKSSPGRLLVASDPVIGRWTPGRSTESWASNQHWAQLPVPHSLIWCSPPTHVYIRRDSELCLHLLWCLR